MKLFATAAVLLAIGCGGDLPEVPEQAPLSSTHVVVVGDTLYGIAKQRLGNGERWRELELLNPGVNTMRLKPGTVIQLPKR